MRAFTALAILLTLAAGAAVAQSATDFSGNWTLSSSESDLRSPSVIPAGYLRIQQDPSAMTAAASESEGAPAATVVYPLRPPAQKSQVAGYVLNVMTKWEGDALLSSILVSGPENYSLMERWSRSRDGGRLTVTRTLVRAAGETESTLVYRSPNAAVTSASPPPVRAPVPGNVRESGSGSGFVSAPRPITDSSQEFSRRPDAAPSPEYVVNAGSRILLRLTSSVNTKHSAVGDRVYLQTAAP